MNVISKEGHCLKSVQIRSYFWSVFSCILKLFTQWVIFSPNFVTHVEELIQCLNLSGESQIFYVKVTEGSEMRVTDRDNRGREP